MTSQPPLYKVFISSTYLDNRDRRKLVQDAVTGVGMVWHGMELFTADTRPVKESCLAYAREADLLVGIIAHRYGWIPHGETRSITEMEYDAARAAGKDCLMFRIDPALPVVADRDLDPGPDRWEKQEKLAMFREKMDDHQMPGYFTAYFLQAKVMEALRMWRDQKEAAGTRTAPPDALWDSRSWDMIVQSYCHKAESRHATLPVTGFATCLRVPIDIDDVHIPLHARVDLRGVREAPFFDSFHADACLRGSDRVLSLPLSQAFGECARRKRKGLVILGDPGAGKTTHLKRILLFCLRKSPKALGLPSGMLPVYLPLRELTDPDHGLDRFIQDQLNRPHLHLPEDFGYRLIHRGNLLFLLDGLDEVADMRHREKVALWIEAAVTAHPSCRFVVTSRFAGYTPAVRMSAHFLELHVRPMDGDQAHTFVRKWYGVVETDLHPDPKKAARVAADKANDLNQRLRSEDFRARRVFELTRNPLLLTNICLVHFHRGSLPRKRVRLYEECIDVLLENWRAAKKIRVNVTAPMGREVLSPLISVSCTWPFRSTWRPMRFGAGRVRTPG